jgi:predicted PurR-regulated permease PerM
MPVRSSAPSIVRTLRRIAIGFLVLFFIWKTLSVDLLIFAGIVVAVFLGETSAIVSRRIHLPYRASFALVVLSLILAAVAVCWFFAQSLIAQFEQLFFLLNDAATKLQQQFPIEWHRFFTQSVTSTELSTAFNGLFGVFSSVFFVVGAVIVVVFFGLYLAAEPGLYERGIISLVPPSHRPKVQDLLTLLGETLWHWMLGRVFSIAVIGTTITAGLWALGIPLPIALGLLAAILALIPYLGAIASAVPSLLLAFTIDIQHAAYVLMLYVTIHILEGYILIPLVQRKASHIPPALALVGELIMGLAAGVLGLLLAMPLTAILIALIRELYVQDVSAD